MNEITSELIKQFELNGIDVSSTKIIEAIENISQNYQIVKSKNIGNKTIVENLEYYLNCKRIDGVEESTLYVYKYKLTSLGKFCNIETNKISSDDIREYISIMQSKLKQSTIIGTIEVFKAYFNWMQKHGYITLNPCATIKTPKRDRRLRKYLTISQLEKIRSACKTDRERCLLEFLLSTGCRVSEVVGLKVTDIVSDSITIFGKGDKERIVYVNEKSKKYINDYLNSRKNNNDYMFSGDRKDCEYIKEKAIEDAMSKIGKRAGIHIYPHLIRHTCASHMLQQGASLTTIMEILGHEDYKTTLGYARTNSRLIKSEHEKFAVV